MRLHLFVAAAAMFSASFAAHADTITVVLDNPNQVSTAGADVALIFDATISAPATNTGNYYLNDSVVGLNNTLATDDATHFYNYFPAFLTPGESATGEFFDAFPRSSPVGVYTGKVGVFGGANSTSEYLTASNLFSVTVIPVTVASPTPEPSSLLLLGTGLLGVGGAIRRRLS